MFLILFLAASYSHPVINGDDPTPEPTRSPYATIMSTKPTLAIALSTCIACIVFMILATSYKCISKAPDDDLLDGMHEQLLVTHDNLNE